MPGHRAAERHLLHIVMMAALVALAAAQADAQTLQLEVSGGPVVLTLDGARLGHGGGLLSAEHATSRLSWRPNWNPCKIVVSTHSPGQAFQLSVAVFDLEGIGTPLAPVALVDGMFPQDLVRDLQRDPPINTGRGTLRYVAEASVEQGNSISAGADVHVVTFTIVEQ
jgi:hypothetical protein